jgi:hypothetical protein
MYPRIRWEMAEYPLGYAEHTSGTTGPQDSLSYCLTSFTAISNIKCAETKHRTSNNVTKQATRHYSSVWSQMENIIIISKLVWFQ